MPNAGKGGQPTKKRMYVRLEKRIQGPESFPLQLGVAVIVKNVNDIQLKKRLRESTLELIMLPGG